MDVLLNPIAGEAPCGEYLKGNRTLYRGLRNGFNLAQSSFRQLIESPDAATDEALQSANRDNWLALARQCEDTLTNTSKDVEVFCWLATAQLFGAAPLEGLATVLDTFAAAVERFWPDLNPKPPADKLSADDDAGRRREWAESRVKPLLQLIGDSADGGLLYMPLQMTALVGDIDYSRYYSAEKSGDLPALKAEAQALLGAGKTAVIDTVMALGRILETLARLESGIGERCREDGLNGPSFRYVRDSIERLLGALRYLVGDQLKPWPLDKAAPAADSAPAQTPAEPAEEPAGTGAPATSALEAMVTLAGGGEIYHRDQAFRELRRIADFFARTEPHSPVYMLLERAIRWGYLSLPELLAEMVGDDSAVMGRITQLAGLESIDRTEIPEARISARELQQRRQTGTATAPPAPAQERREEAIAPTPAATTSAEPEGSGIGIGISSFEW